MINFPDSPTVDDVFTYGSLSWTWDGTKWTATTAAAATYNQGEVLGQPDPGSAAPVPADVALMLRASLGDGVAGQVVTSGGPAVDPAWDDVTDSGVLGPGSSVNNHLAAWVGTAGDTLSDSGIAAAAVLVSGGALGTPSGGIAANLTSINVAAAINILGATHGGAGNVSGILKADGAGNVSAASAGTDYATIAQAKTEILVVAVSDETTNLTTGTAKVTFRMPFAIALSAVRASLTTASSSGIPAVDVKESGTSIFSTTLTIDATEKTSVTAATAAVISDPNIADDAEMTIDIPTAGTGAKGLKVAFIGTRA